MSREQRETVEQMLRDAPFDLGGDPAVQRPLLEQMLTAQPLPSDVRTSPGRLGDVPVTEVELSGAKAGGVILHVHGGGFAMGSATGSVGLLSDLARRAGMSALAVEYRLAPEHPYPAGLDDVVAAYRGLLDREGGPERVVVTGESAGGNLALELLIRAREQGLAMPAAAIVFSPMTDLTVSGESFTAKADVDPNITGVALATRIRDYLDATGTDPSDASASPIFADLTGLPPLLVQVGSHEVLLSDAIQLAARAALDDVAVTLDVIPGVGHVSQAFAAILTEADEALTRAGRFAREHVPSAT